MGADFNGLCSMLSNTSIANTWSTSATTAGATIYGNYLNDGFYQQAYNGVVPVAAEAPTEKKRKKRELSANERWLNDRVNEMRVKL